MTDYKFAGWLLVALAVVGLAFAAPVVSADGTDTTADDAPPYDGSAGDWAARMEAHMTEHMGPGAVDEMESHMGVTVDEMARDGGHVNHTAGSTHHADHTHTAGGMNGQAHGC